MSKNDTILIITFVKLIPICLFLFLELTITILLALSAWTQKVVDDCSADCSVTTRFQVNIWPCNYIHKLMSFKQVQREITQGIVKLSKTAESNDHNRQKYFNRQTLATYCYLTYRLEADCVNTWNQMIGCLIFRLLFSRTFWIGAISLWEVLPEFTMYLDFGCNGNVIWFGMKFEAFNRVS